jgi:tRNA C32,U32 (ribose-2'-O)-methylase TrmJ
MKILCLLSVTLLAAGPATAETRVRIPMLGLKHSLNVATAAGVVAYELLRRYRRAREAACGRRAEAEADLPARSTRTP